MIGSRNNILASKNPVVTNKSLKSMVKDSATIKEVVSEEKVYQKCRPRSAYVSKMRTVKSRKSYAGVGMQNWDRSGDGGVYGIGMRSRGM